ncbi:MAG: dihydroneopterin aldolase [Kofleriaceae bacterium]|nr:dihydroneopterin aldolase [Myxococcales bacterium]MCB9563322.1 dihydroneopterin aldolase [Kofleriaceae bacterium]MCB9572247.1 dihydroneopterin aldolase [Kofleriaceae bacterium]
MTPPGPDAVFVRGIEFEGNHGYTAAERRSTRRFRVELVMELPLTAASQSDRIADTVDYFKVSELAVSIGTGSTFRLLERLAGEIGRAIQEHYPRVAVTVVLEKLSPPCPGVPAASGVRLHLPARDRR